jgi:L-gulonate 5-dehydrogenase
MVAIAVEKPHVIKLFDAASEPLGEGQVRLRVKRAGICGSDLHILHGANPFATYPRIIGHEFAGEVAAIGAGVTALAVGDRVVVDPVVSCGRCDACRRGRHNVCSRLQVFGVHRDGGFRDEVIVPAANAVKVPHDLPFDVAALAEPFSIAANVLARTGCDASDAVLIYGAGTIGITVLQVARMFGARCIVVDIDAERLRRAERFGADKTIDSTKASVADSVAGELDGVGPSVVVDAAGVPALLAEACKVAAPAARIGILGFSPAPCNVSQQEIVRKELTLVGSRLNRGLLPQVVDWLASGRLKPAAMISQTFRAQDAREAFALIETHPEQTLKVQLAFDA